MVVDFVVSSSEWSSIYLQLRVNFLSGNLTLYGGLTTALVRGPRNETPILAVEDRGRAS